MMESNNLQDLREAIYEQYMYTSRVFWHSEGILFKSEYYETVYKLAFLYFILSVISNDILIV